MVWKQFLLILVMAIVAVVAFNFARPYIFSKFNLKRRYILIFLAVLFVLPMILQKVYIIPIVQYLHFFLITFGVLIYMELVKIEKQIRNRPVVGRPKAKPSKSKNSK